MRTRGGGATALRRATEAGYREMFGALETLAFPYPLRIWNFLIRHQLADRGWRALLALQRRAPGRLHRPEAQYRRQRAGGERGGRRAAASPLTVYCIASAQAPIALENPRQCSAWDYPAQYGPRSPTFARACIEQRCRADPVHLRHRQHRRP